MPTIQELGRIYTIQSGNSFQPAFLKRKVASLAVSTLMPKHITLKTKKKNVNPENGGRP